MVHSPKKFDVLYLGQFGGKEYYCDLFSGKIWVYIPPYVREMKKRFTFYEWVHAPLILLLSFSLYLLLRSHAFPTVGNMPNVLVFVLLSCGGGLTAAALLAMSSRKRGERRCANGVEADGEGVQAICHALRKNTSIVLTAFPILLALLVATPFFFSDESNLLALCAYILGWFLCGLVLFSVRPLKRLEALRHLERRSELLKQSRDGGMKE